MGAFLDQCFHFTGGWLIFWESHSLQPPPPTAHRFVSLSQNNSCYCWKGRVGSCEWASSPICLVWRMRKAFIYLFIFNPESHRYVKACPSCIALQTVIIFSSTRLHAVWINSCVCIFLNWREIHSLTAAGWCLGLSCGLPQPSYLPENRTKGWYVAGSLTLL